jgi:hypothetical protein
MKKTEKPKDQEQPEGREKYLSLDREEPRIKSPTQLRDPWRPVRACSDRAQGRRSLCSRRPALPMTSTA